MFSALKGLLRPGSDQDKIPVFIDEPGKGYRGPTPAKAVAKAPAVVDPTVQVLAPVDGRVLGLNQVDDPSFAKQHLGMGLAIDAESGQVLAPVAGTISFPFATNHAFVIATPTGVDVLVHIGFGTNALPGDTFQAQVADGVEVSASQVVVAFDFDEVNRQATSLITCVVVQSLGNQALVFRPNAGGLGVFAGDDLFSLEVG